MLQLEICMGKFTVAIRMREETSQAHLVSIILHVL